LKATRRLRPTFLLQLVIALGCLVILATSLALFAKGMSLLVLIALVAFWFLAFELELLPMLLERYAIRSAEGGRPVSTRWFVDVAAEDAAARDRRQKEVKGNSALW
jgi:hypothetical protein